MDAPTVQINASELNNLISFIYSQQESLKHFGAIKIELSSECLLALKKRQISPSCTKIQQIRKVVKNESIYSVDQVNITNRFTEKASSILDEKSFWSSLSNPDNKIDYSNVTILPNKSFFKKKVHRKYFDIHRFPKQSLLKLSGNNITNKIVPCLTISHGSGGISPLCCAQQGLAILDYHHSGGKRYWYIIPSYQRTHFYKIIEEQIYLTYLKDKQLIIDPSLLDKFNIQYSRIVQKSNEFLVLASAVVTQSLTFDASYNESIAFALPNWIDDGYYNQRLQLLDWNINHPSIQQTIDINLFTQERIQKYIHIQIYQNNSSKKLVKTKSIKSVKNIYSIDKLPLTPVLSPKINSIIQEDQKKEFNNQSENLKRLIKSNLFEDLNQFLKMEEDQPEISYHRESIDDDYSSLDHLMNIIPLTPPSNLSTFSQIDQLIDSYIYNLNQQSNDFSSIQLKSKKAKDFKKVKVNNRKTLFLSGLKFDIKYIDIRNHFTGSNKIRIKKSKSDNSLKYAFIGHKTAQQAKYNIQKRLNLNIFGSQSRVEYVHDHSNLNFKNQFYDKRIISVRKIPSNVNQSDLCQLFPNASLIKYSPTKILHNTKTSFNKNKILSGYAFLKYSNHIEAANVIEHADKYRINGQPLIISPYHGNKQLY